MSDKPCRWLAYTGSECKLENVKVFKFKLEALNYLETYQRAYEDKYDEKMDLKDMVLKTRAQFGRPSVIMGKAILVQME